MPINTRDTGLNLACRTGPRHSWDEIPVTKRPEFGTYVWWRCTRCATVRKYIYDVNGRVASRSYVHPDDWTKLRRDEYNPDEIRLAYLRTVKTKKDAAGEARRRTKPLRAAGKRTK